MSDSPFFTEAETAAYLGISQATLARWRWKADCGPVYRKFGGAVRYAKADLDTYAAASEVAR